MTRDKGSHRRTVVDQYVDQQNKYVAQLLFSKRNCRFFKKYIQFDHKIMQGFSISIVKISLPTNITNFSIHIITIMDISINE